MELDDWNDLRFVLAAHREGTVTAAARALGVDQTTVSRRLRSLQARAGFPLFEQLRGGVLLTPAGEAFVSAAEEVERRLHTLARETLGATAPLRGALRVTLPEVLAATWIDVFAAFAEQYPGIELTVLASDQIRDITRREADVALRNTDAPPEHLVGRRIGWMALASYTARHVPEGTSLPWIGWEQGMVVERVQERWKQKNRLDGAPLFRVDSFFVQLEALKRGVAQGLLPCGCADRLPELRRVHGPDPELRAPLWVLTHPDLRRVPRVRALLDHLGRWCSANTDLLEGRRPHG